MAAIVEVRDEAIALEHSDREQFFAILGVRLSGAVLGADGRVVVSNVANVPAELRNDIIAAGPARSFDAGSGENGVRISRSAIVASGRTVGYVAAWRPLQWFERLDRLVLLGAATAMLLISAPAIAVGALIARRGLQPLERIADVASEIEAHDLALRLDEVPDARDELGRLAHTFNRMLDRLEHGFERERRFAADASHELRAPLAVLAAETGLALRRERDAESYRTTLRTIASVVGELQSITDDLLAAARSGEGAPLDALDLGELATSVIERARPLAREHDVALEAQLEPGIRAFADPNALARALLALLHNALKFTPRGGCIRVSVVGESAAGVLRVSDSGPGFSSEALAHATERFWRDDRARTPGTGSGLGLAIARATVERAGGSIELANASAGGAIVALRLRAA